MTYFLLDDEEFASWLTTKKYASVASVPKSELQTMLKGYTLPGLYHSADLTTSPIDVLTCNGVLSIRLRLYPNPPTSSQDLNAMQAGYVNEDGKLQQMPYDKFASDEWDCTSFAYPVLGFVVYEVFFLK